MSVLTKCLECLDEVNWLDALKRAILKDSDGNYYLNLYYSDCDDCDNFEPAVECSSDYSFEEMIKATLVEDDCGFCAIALTGNVCSACE